jgi:hypothetical protein
MEPVADVMLVSCQMNPQGDTAMQEGEEDEQ